MSLKTVLSHFTFRKNDAGHNRPKWLSAVRPGILLTAALAAAILPFAYGQKPASVMSTEELPSGTMQAKATTSCLECHEARIILQQRLGKAAWTKEVDKMIKWGTVLDASDHDALIDYLSTNFSPDQPPYEPPRTASEKTSGKNSTTKKSK